MNEVLLSPGQSVLVSARIAESPARDSESLRRLRKFTAAIADFVPQLQAQNAESTDVIDFRFGVETLSLIEDLRRDRITVPTLRENMTEVLSRGQDWSIPPKVVKDRAEAIIGYMRQTAARLPQTKAS